MESPDSTVKEVKGRTPRRSAREKSPVCELPNKGHSSLPVGATNRSSFTGDPLFFQDELLELAAVDTLGRVQSKRHANEMPYQSPRYRDTVVMATPRHSDGEMAPDSVCLESVTFQRAELDLVVLERSSEGIATPSNYQTPRNNPLTSSSIYQTPTSSTKCSQTLHTPTLRKGNSPRVMVRIDDIHGGLSKASLSTNFVEPRSPTDVMLKNISKTLLRKNIRPSSSAQRRMDFSNVDEPSDANATRLTSSRKSAGTPATVHSHHIDEDAGDDGEKITHKTGYPVPVRGQPYDSQYRPSFSFEWHRVTEASMKDDRRMCTPTEQNRVRGTVWGTFPSLPSYDHGHSGVSEEAFLPQQVESAVTPVEHRSRSPEVAATAPEMPGLASLPPINIFSKSQQDLDHFPNFQAAENSQSMVTLPNRSFSPVRSRSASAYGGTSMSGNHGLNYQSIGFPQLRTNAMVTPASQLATPVTPVLMTPNCDFLQDHLHVLDPLSVGVENSNYPARPESARSAYDVTEPRSTVMHSPTLGLPLFTSQLDWLSAPFLRPIPVPLPSPTALIQSEPVDAQEHLPPHSTVSTNFTSIMNRKRAFDPVISGQVMASHDSRDDVGPGHVIKKKQKASGTSVKRSRKKRKKQATWNKSVTVRDILERRKNQIPQPLNYDEINAKIAKDEHSKPAELQPSRSHPAGNDTVLAAEGLSTFWQNARRASSDGGGSGVESLAVDSQTVVSQIEVTEATHVNQDGTTGNISCLSKENLGTYVDKQPSSVLQRAPESDNHKNQNTKSTLVRDMVKNELSAMYQQVANARAASLFRQPLVDEKGNKLIGQPRVQVPKLYVAIQQVLNRVRNPKKELIERQKYENSNKDTNSDVCEVTTNQNPDPLMTSSTAYQPRFDTGEVTTNQNPDPLMTSSTTYQPEKESCDSVKSDGTRIDAADMEHCLRSHDLDKCSTGTDNIANLNAEISNGDFTHIRSKAVDEAHYSYPQTDMFTVDHSATLHASNTQAHLCPLGQFPPTQTDLSNIHTEVPSVGQCSTTQTEVSSMDHCQGFISNVDNCPVSRADASQQPAVIGQSDPQSTLYASSLLTCRMTPYSSQGFCFTSAAPNPPVMYVSQANTYTQASNTWTPIGNHFLLPPNLNPMPVPLTYSQPDATCPPLQHLSEMAAPYCTQTYPDPSLSSLPVSMGAANSGQGDGHPVFIPPNSMYNIWQKPAQPILLQTGMVDKPQVSIPRPRHFDIGTLQVGTFKRVNESTSFPNVCFDGVLTLFEVLFRSGGQQKYSRADGHKYAKAKLIFSKRKFIYELELDRIKTPGGLHIASYASVEIPFNGIVGVKAERTRIFLEVGFRPHVFCGQRPVDSKGMSLPHKPIIYNRQNMCDFSGGQLATVPYHMLVLHRPVGERLMQCLCDFDDYFKLLRTNGLDIDPTKQLTAWPPTPAVLPMLSVPLIQAGSNVSIETRKPATKYQENRKPFCSCVAGCLFTRCKCVQAVQKCRTGCKCLMFNNCLNPINQMDALGIDVDRAKTDICMMANVFRIKSLENYLNRFIIFPCCHVSTGLRECIPGRVPCPNMVSGTCSRVYQYSWCGGDLYDEGLGGRNHCSFCAKCVAPKSVHCKFCNNCYVPGPDWDDCLCQFNSTNSAATSGRTSRSKLSQAPSMESVSGINEQPVKSSELGMLGGAGDLRVRADSNPICVQSASDTLQGLLSQPNVPTRPLSAPCPPTDHQILSAHASTHKRHFSAASSTQTGSEQSSAKKERQESSKCSRNIFPDVPLASNAADSVDLLIPLAGDDVTSAKYLLLDREIEETEDEAECYYPPQGSVGSSVADIALPAGATNKTLDILGKPLKTSSPIIDTQT